jgi:Tfp pilus assembly protein PilF
MLLNANKRSVTLNLKDQRGKQMLRDLIAKADIFAENFAPGVIEKLGFSYEEAAAICECAVGTIKSRVNRARTRLSELLSIDGSDDFGPDQSTRAILSAGGTSIKTLTRGFEIAPPKVLLTSADGLGDNSTDVELFLPVDETTMMPAFQRDFAVRGETLAPFLDRLAPAVKTTFDQGVGFLASGDYSKAEASFKRAIDPDLDSTAPLTFLAACFAASGHDREAASAWQTALVEGTDFPQIYQWLGDALLRNHDFGEARAIYEEAIAKWPADVRFTKPLAMLYGTFGKGREAVRTLERYLEEQQDDREAYYFAVQWLYTVHIGGAMVHNRVEDLNLAREYADAYAQANGPQLPLVRQWVDYLQNEGKRP